MLKLIGWELITLNSFFNLIVKKRLNYDQELAGTDLASEFGS